VVNDRGQLYTIEGVAAAILMLLTAYLTLSTTTIYTPADTHVIDMQLEQLGNDALAMMDTADTADWGAGDGDPFESYLERLIMDYNIPDFENTLNKYLNTQYNGLDVDRPIHFTSMIYYRDSSDQLQRLDFSPASTLPVGFRPVTVTRFIFIKYTDPPSGIFDFIDRYNDQVVLLEVTLWRD
jgi:hypothetical protein